MGIPLWREPSEVDALKSVEKDATAAARSVIRRHAVPRRSSRQARTRGPGLLSSFQSQILDEIQRGVRGVGEPQMGVRSPVLNLGISEDGLDLDSSRRDALGRNPPHPPPRQGDHPIRRPRTDREEALADLLSRRDPHLDSRSGARFASPSLTPNFAPAVAYHTSAPSHPSAESTRPITIPRLPRLRIHNRDPNPNPPSDSSSFTNRDYRPSWIPNRLTRESGMDGLGDRQRSVSPDGDRETDTWEPMRSTITPDVNLPSTDTSFTSFVAAHSTDTPRNGTLRPSATSSLTLPPVQLALDAYPDHLHPCDLSSDDEDGPVIHRLIGTSGFPHVPRSRGLHSTISNHPPIPTISLSFSDSSSDTHLQQMQAILDRLARREEIPEDWWAGAGLSHNMGRGLSTGANPQNNDNDNDRTFDQ
ncbi:hypothetical protein N7493_009236 [Penicillium malachiteum]|uniref:Uncharacterized protein n=1 Tax=Penicillium malachiteum TaxID=1324776 RepID=A0AAD6HG79_9EURO|nr:hypothetical protein N7493_009236 [Penicillium malachiteum]